MLAGVCRRASTNIPRICSSTSFVKSFPLQASISTSGFRPATQRLPQISNRRYLATMAANTPYVTLNDGNKMPQVGFGLWKVDNATCADTVYNAIKTGYRLFDGACGMCETS
jgi:D-xylose reductase